MQILGINPRWTPRTCHNGTQRYGFFWTRGLRVVVGDPKISIDIPSRRLSHAIVKDSNRSTTVALLTIERVDVVATIPKNWENRW